VSLRSGDYESLSESPKAAHARAAIRATSRFDRLTAQSPPPAAIIAILRPSEPQGFVFLTATAGDNAGAEEIQIGDSGTIGMLYDTMAAGQATYKIPHSWGGRVRRLANA